ncbi:uncharacterized protein LOC130679658 [Manis pentadactyla]|uniref:uncharacterized protein LOC130679658 n=1 Tax=Manis pentadactyla TaxID=143292 RepID=UPI00255CC1E1|nr:uncharacterized protein LOC130679658 [Manis pentadactyla]
MAAQEQELQTSVDSLKREMVLMREKVARECELQTSVDSLRKKMAWMLEELFAFASMLAPWWSPGIRDFGHIWGLVRDPGDPQDSRPRGPSAGCSYRFFLPLRRERGSRWKPGSQFWATIDSPPRTQSSSMLLFPSLVQTGTTIQQKIILRSDRDTLRNWPLDKYVDDILVATEDQERCLQGTKDLLSTLGALGYRALAKKVQICKTEVNYLGYKLKGRQRWLTEARKETVLRIPHPQNVCQMREFLGSAGYCRLWIPGFAEIARHL